MLQATPLTSPLPHEFGLGDSHFHFRKTARVYVCDGCGRTVCYSSRSRKTGLRSAGEFQGNYCDTSWAQTIPICLLPRAHAEGLIDARWECTVECGRAPMGADKDRQERAAEWRRSQDRGGSTNRGDGWQSWSRWPSWHASEWSHHHQHWQSWNARSSLSRDVPWR